MSSTNQHILLIFSWGTLFHPLAFAFPFCRACCDSLHGYCHSMLNLVSITATLGSDPAKIRKSFFFRSQCFDFSQRYTYTTKGSKSLQAFIILNNSISWSNQIILSCPPSTKHCRFFRNVYPFNDSNKIKIEKNDNYASINRQDILAGAVLKEGKISERTVLVQSNLKKTFKC